MEWGVKRTEKKEDAGKRGLERRGRRRNVSQTILRHTWSSSCSMSSLIDLQATQRSAGFKVERSPAQLTLAVSSLFRPSLASLSHSKGKLLWGQAPSIITSTHLYSSHESFQWVVILLLPLLFLLGSTPFSPKAKFPGYPLLYGLLALPLHSIFAPVRGVIEITAGGQTPRWWGEKN